MKETCIEFSVPPSISGNNIQNVLFSARTGHWDWSIRPKSRLLSVQNWIQLQKASEWWKTFLDNKSMFDTFLNNISGKQFSEYPKNILA